MEKLDFFFVICLSYLCLIELPFCADSAILSVVDYKLTFRKEYPNEKEKLLAYSECHTRSARRVLSALLANGGIFIKLGQHMSSLYVF